jgi:integrase
MHGVNPSGKHRPKRRHHGEGSRPFLAADARRQRPWRCALRLGRDPETGRLRTKWFSGTSASDAATQRDDYLKRLRRARTPEAAESTVADVLNAYLAERTGNVDVSTWSRYDVAVRLHLIPSLGKVSLPMLTTTAIAAARDSWGTSASSVNLAHGCLRAALELAVARGQLTDSPMAGVPRRRKSEPARRYLDIEDARKLIVALKGDRIERMVIVALGVGPRRGEVLGMRWRDLDLKAGTWKTDMQLRWIPESDRQPDDGPYALLPPKAGHARGRVVALPAFVVDALTAQQAKQDATRAAAKVWAPNDLVFADAFGNPTPPGSVSRRFTRLAKRAGIDATFHTLRHSAATIMLAMGVQERVVQSVLGHASGEQTRAYMHVVSTLGEVAADKMGEALG